MRNLYCNVEALRKQVFAAVAKLAYEGGDYCSRMEKLPYEIIPGEVGTYRESIFLERAIVGERIRLAMGLPLRDVTEENMISDGVEASAISEKYYDPPLINIIKYACHACPDTHYEVTQACQGCLAKHCYQSCPKGAIELEHGRARIDQTKCIKCGRCKEACSYQAIIKFLRPCQEACGMNAIGKDQYGRADIDHEKCVNCGQCLVNCPFGAIVDKGQIFQVIQSILKGDRVIAIVAPAFIGQFSGKVSPGKFVTAMKQLGFDRVMEVAIGADLCTIEEAKDFLEKVPEKQDYMATSCCPAWHSMIEKLFPGEMHKISMTLTPMVFTARMVKKDFPGCKVVFVGPCAAKKLEAIRADIRSDVDFVLTFEELAGIIEAKDLDLDNLEVDPAEMDLCYASAAGRGFAQSGGVAKAVADKIKEWRPDMEVKIASAQGLADCKKLLMLAKAGKYNGYLLEGMGCPGGCIGGAGTIADPVRTAAVLNKYVKDATFTDPEQSAFMSNIHMLKDDPNFEV